MDDDVDSAEVLDEFLRSEGYDVLVAHDGTRALAHAATLRPHVVLLEIHLRGAELNAYELCRKLAAAGDARPRRIIALTSRSKMDEAQLREAGFDAHLEKPIHMGRLLELMAAGS